MSKAADCDAYNSCILFVGSRPSMGVEAARIILSSGVPITGICGASAKFVINEINREFSLGANCRIVTRLRPWEDLSFMNLLSERVLGVNAGLEVLVPKNILDRINILNLHPSFLPYNKGSHHSFWSIMDSTPAGASIHWMVDELDAGPIIDQEQIQLDLLSTAQQVQEMCELKCLELLSRNIKTLMKRSPIKCIENAGGNIHYKRQIEKASTLTDHQVYSGSHVFNLIRATKHSDYGFFIVVSGRKFMIRIRDIKEL